MPDISDILVVTFDHYGDDKTVLVVGRQINSRLDTLSVTVGGDAEQLYRKLTGGDFNV